jgi:alkylation response protein AidB-like acyl-CoA dehydrogenase
MDFEDSPEESSLRAEAREWLHDHAELRTSGARSSISLFESHRPGEEKRWVDDCRRWQRTKLNGGWAAVSWPKEWGGRDGTTMDQIIFNQEESRFDVASGAFGITLGMIAPTVLAHGTDEQRSHVPRMLGGGRVVVSAVQ